MKDYFKDPTVPLPIAVLLNDAQKAVAEGAPFQPRYQPDNCPHCEYDRRFPDTAEGGWVYMGNNGPISPCPFCNPHGTYPRR